jgi:hypothetical protein
LSDSTTGAGAVAQGSDISGSFPLTITGSSNDDLKVRTASGDAYTTVTIAAGAYANITTLAAAVNAALVGTGITAREGTTDDTLALEGPAGVDSYVGIDSEAGGSTALPDLGLGTAAIVREMPSATTIITGCNPVGGTLNVSVTKINTLGSGTSSTAFAFIPSARGTHEALADAIAPQFIETKVVEDSFLVGYVAGLRSSSYNPDPRQGLTAGAAIQVVQDDGSSAMTWTLPTISSATLDSPSAGDVTIAGTGLGDAEVSETVVKFTGDVAKSVNQAQIVAAGGSVTATAVVVPASLIPGAATTTTSVQVRVRGRISAAEALA